MYVIKNSIIPFKGYSAMNILGLLFVRKDITLSKRVLRHEKIHSVQQYELLLVSAILSLVACAIWQSWWYILITVTMPIAVYLLAWFIALLLPPYNRAYKDSPFEREAYVKEIDIYYLWNRKPFGWVKFIKS